jgi:hypothetical protein
MEASPGRVLNMLQRLLRYALIACLLVLAGCPKGPSKTSALDEIQYAWSAAVRWGDFEGAWNLVDPKVRKDHPMTELEFSRYKQVQISTYRDTGSSLVGGEVVRDIEIGVINRNTLAERTVRYRERWRYDEEAKTWWLTTGMPDLWKGE